MRNANNTAPTGTAITSIRACCAGNSSKIKVTSTLDLHNNFLRNNFEGSITRKEATIQTLDTRMISAINRVTTITAMIGMHKTTDMILAMINNAMTLDLIRATINNDTTHAMIRATTRVTMTMHKTIRGDASMIRGAARTTHGDAGTILGVAEEAMISEDS
jgi:hypothetical protein